MKSDTTSLKAQAYDALAQIEYWQRELRKINSLIVKGVEDEQNRKAIGHQSGPGGQSKEKTPAGKGKD